MKWRFWPRAYVLDNGLRWQYGCALWFHTFYALILRYDVCATAALVFYGLVQTKLSTSSPPPLLSGEHDDLSFQHVLDPRASLCTAAMKLSRL